MTDLAILSSKAISKPEVPSSVVEYQESTEERRWELAYVNKIFYLTDQEADYFIKMISEKKARIVRVGALFLTKSFIYLSPISDKKEYAEGEYNPHKDPLLIQALEEKKRQ
jgi:hypothetical protein